MSEIAIISTREVIYEPSLQKSGKIKVTLKLLQGYGVWNLDAMVHDYDYLHGANRNFIKKWKADIKYIKNMERNGKGIRVFRLLLLTIIGIIFVPYCFIKYKIT